MTLDKPLTPMQEAFARAYSGDGVRACQAAGYGGSASVLSSRAWKLLQDPRVVAIIEARRVQAPRSAPEHAEPATEAPPTAPAALSASSADDEPGGRHVDVDDATPIGVLAELMRDSTVLASSRVAAAKALERRERELRAAEGDEYEQLRARVAAIHRDLLERERTTGCCSRCGADLPRGRV